MANLTALQVKSLRPATNTKRYSDGRGLYLVVKPSGAKSWVLRVVINGRRTDMGLGSYPDVPLARAREKTHEFRAAVADGRDPRAERRREPTLPTFREAAERYFQTNAPTWRNPKTLTRSAV